MGVHPLESVYVPPLLSAAVGSNNTHKTFINTLMYSISKQEHVPSCLCDVDQRT